MILTRAVTSSRKSRLATESNTEKLKCDQIHSKSGKRKREGKLTRWGREGGGGIGVEKDRSSDGEEQ